MPTPNPAPKLKLKPTTRIQLTPERKGELRRQILSCPATSPQEAFEEIQPTDLTLHQFSRAWHEVRSGEQTEADKCQESEVSELTAEITPETTTEAASEPRRKGKSKA